MTKRKIIAGIVALIMLLGLVGTIYSVRQKPEPLASPQTDNSTETLPADLELPLPSAPVKSLADTKQLNVLLLGYGGAGHQGGFLSDVIMVASLDFENKKMSLIHIPRDLWVHIPVGNTVLDTKINGALALGTKTNNYPTADLPQDTILRGSYLTKMALKTVTGLDIDYVIGVDFNGFSRALDSLGGVNVNVPQTFEDPWYPVKGRELELCGKTPEEVTRLSQTMSGFELEKQFPCRYERLYFEQGSTKMDGATALKFVRSRHSSTHGGDFARGERQSALLLGIQDQLFSLKALDNIPRFFALLYKSIKTDISPEAVVALAPALKDVPTYQVNRIGLSTANTLNSATSRTGASILVPRAGDGIFTEIQQYLRSEAGR